MFRFAFKTKKSAGVRVTRAVHHLIAQGNAARDADDWSTAADAYRRALAAAPELHHIRMQLGHALKHIGQVREADAAYAMAAQASPDDIEPIRLRAHLAKDSGRIDNAIGYLGQALATPMRAEAAAEINVLIDAATPLSADALAAILADIGSTAPHAAVPNAIGDASQTQLIFDLTDLVAHFDSQRRPNGIERVQIELARAALDTRGPDRVTLCCFVRSREQWVAIPAHYFLDVARLAASGGDVGDGAWQAARARLMLRLMVAGAIDLPRHGVLVNAGTSWRVHDYFRFVRNARARSGIRYMPFVHDLIPLVASEHCVPGITEDFISWLIGAVRHADAFLVNSRATRADLMAAARTLGHPIAEDRIEVVPLDADFRRAADELPASGLRRWKLEGVPFALMVSTIESRKNHVLAFDAWQALALKHGAAAVPRLVCVGRNGWLNAHAFARLDADPTLKAMVTLIDDVSDAELALLYRSCAFTIYPSLYEGWGLPITEALSYGRIAVVADNSSLPEASGGFGLLFASGSVLAFVAALEQVIFDPDWKAEREAAIARGFAPRSWAQLEAQVDAAATALAGHADAQPGPPSAQVNRYHPLGLRRARHIWPGLGSGEIFRQGNGWVWPEFDRCRITPQGGELGFSIGTPDAGPMRLHLHLRGLANADCPVTISVDGHPVEAAPVPAGASAWVTCPLAPGASAIAIHVAGAATEAVTLSVCGMDKVDSASIGVLGFLLDDGSDPLVAAAVADADDPNGILSRLDAYADPESSAAG